ncbi:MAG: NUDIX domain-containing protein [Oscillospiraceae bacterium]|nr:NUDIX domain-containing protein [Oscillospiraceae bacterium]
MHFDYCPHCGQKTAMRQMGDDGAVPYCEQCGIPLFDMFSTCVLSVVISPAGEIALIRQSYGQQEFFVGVAGYMKPGETAEEAAAREITEEIGITPERTEFAFSRWHSAKGQLMLCFCAFSAQDAFTCSQEVREAKWFTPQQALQACRPGSIIGQLVQYAVGLPTMQSLQKMHEIGGKKF